MEELATSMMRASLDDLAHPALVSAVLSVNDYRPMYDPTNGTLEDAQLEVASRMQYCLVRSGTARFEQPVDVHVNSNHRAPLAAILSKLGFTLQTSTLNFAQFEGTEWVTIRWAERPNWVPTAQSKRVKVDGNGPSTADRVRGLPAGALGDAIQARPECRAVARDGRRREVELRGDGDAPRR